MVTDLTMTVRPSMPAFPGSPAPHIMPWSRLSAEGYNDEVVAMSSHAGTHVDAPYHFDARGARIASVPAGRLVRRAALVRAPKRAGQNVTLRDIRNFERKHGKLGSGASVVFATGWSDRMPRDYFSHSPGLEPAAARALARIDTNMVGIDSPSIDAGGSRRFPAHRALARRGTLIVENLRNLGALRGSYFELAVLPLKLGGCSGAPARAVALD